MIPSKIGPQTTKNQNAPNLSQSNFMQFGIQTINNMNNVPPQYQQQYQAQVQQTMSPGGPRNQAKEAQLMQAYQMQN